METRNHLKTGRHRKAKRVGAQKFNNMTTETNKIYKSSYFYRILKGDYNPFTPNIIHINDHDIEYRRRNWYLISVDTQTYHFQYIVGIDVDKHLFGATLIIRTTGNAVIYVQGFPKKRANEIRELCRKYISMNTQRGTTEALAGAIATAVNSVKSSAPVSVADELKKMKELLDSGVISQAEYDSQKARLLNN